MRRLAIPLLLLIGVASADEAPNLANVTPPAGQVTVDHAIETAVKFLVANQNKDGSFGKYASGRSRELWCDIPGGHMAFKTASSALCWLGLNDSPYQTEASRKAQAKCLKFLAHNADVKRAYAQQFYNIWPYAYGLRALGQALRTKAPGADPEAMRDTMRRILKGLAVIQAPDGGWSYLEFRHPLRRPTSSNSFVAATVLVGLHEAQQAGIEVPQKMVDRAVKYVWKTRTRDGNYTYSKGWQYAPYGRINRPQGSSMRNQACNFALELFDAEDMGADKLRIGLDQLRDHHRFATIALRRPRPHESHYAVSGYFYLYGYQYGALVLARMPQKDQEEYWPFVVNALLKTRQMDGSYWDYPTYGYHKFYGTGYALIGLSACPTAIASKLKP